MRTQELLIHLPDGPPRTLKRLLSLASGLFHLIAELAHLDRALIIDLYFNFNGAGI